MSQMSKLNIMIENMLKRDKIQAISTKGNRMHRSLPNRLDIYVGNQPIFYLSDILVKFFVFSPQAWYESHWGGWIPCVVESKHGLRSSKNGILFAFLFAEKIASYLSYFAHLGRLILLEYPPTLMVNLCCVVFSSYN